MTVQVSVPVTPPQLFRYGVSDYRPVDNTSGGGSGFFPFNYPSSPVVLPTHWFFYGDSQTAGRANQATSLNHWTAFRNIWNASGFSQPTTMRSDGLGGRALKETSLEFDNDTFAGTPWIHAQESGGQEGSTAFPDSQNTPERFGDTFEAFMRAINARYPSAVITYESAFSFMKLGEPLRDWETTQNWADWGYPNEPAAKSYNEVLYERIQILRDDGIMVYPVYACEYVNEFVNQLGYPAIEDTESPAHYNGAGNFLIALAMFKALAYDINTLNTSTVVVDSNSVTNTTLRNTCINIINTLGA